MDYKQEYQKKLTTAENAVKIVKSGDWVDYGWCANHPLILDKALAERMVKEPELTGSCLCVTALLLFFYFAQYF